MGYHHLSKIRENFATTSLTSCDFLIFMPNIFSKVAPMKLIDLTNCEIKHFNHHAIQTPDPIEEVC